MCERGGVAMPGASDGTMGKWAGWKVSCQWAGRERDYELEWCVTIMEASCRWLVLRVKETGKTHHGRVLFISAKWWSLWALNPRIRPTLYQLIKRDHLNYKFFQRGSGAGFHRVRLCVCGRSIVCVCVCVGVSVCVRVSVCGCWCWWWWWSCNRKHERRCVRRELNSGPSLGKRRS